MSRSKPIVIRQDRMEWMKIRGGLVRDPKHCEAMGVAVWLYLHFHDAADRQTGLVVTDLERASAELGKSLITIQKWYRKLVDGGYIVSLTQSLKYASRADRRASHAPFLRISRHESETRSGLPKWVAQWAKSHRPLLVDGRPKETFGRPDLVLGRPKETFGRPKMVDPQYRARASEEVLEGLEVREGRETRIRATPPPPDPDPDPEPDPAPAPNAKPLGQSNGHRNGHGPAVAETPRGARGQTVSPPGTDPVPAESDPPPETVDFSDAFDQITDASSTITATLRPQERTAFAQVYERCSHPEPLRVACERTLSKLRGAEHTSGAYRFRYRDALEAWNHAIDQWEAKKNTQREAPRVVAAEDEFARFWGNGSQQDDGGE